MLDIFKKVWYITFEHESVFLNGGFYIMTKEEKIVKKNNLKSKQNKKKVSTKQPKENYFKLVKKEMTNLSESRLRDLITPNIAIGIQYRNISITSDLSKRAIFILQFLFVNRIKK